MSGTQDSSCGVVPLAGTVVSHVTTCTSRYVADGVAKYLQRTSQHKHAALLVLEILGDWVNVDLLPVDPVAVGQEPNLMLEGLIVLSACQSKIR